MPLGAGLAFLQGQYLTDFPLLMAGAHVFPPDPEHVRVYFRFLETSDEYFPYSPAEAGSQGRWNIYGLGLPDDVLRNVYRDNARRLIPGTVGGDGEGRA